MEVVCEGWLHLSAASEAWGHVCYAIDIYGKSQNEVEEFQGLTETQLPALWEPGNGAPFGKRQANALH
ncbi:hypothetical protein ACJJI5_05040 [Microbulbifer sp. EKSA008]|uniref:hypothetical protein n=1 Tax=Microbulbifer sp. EKSA008 TaxID=3243367 RepID=UPI0040430F80